MEPVLRPDQALSAQPTTLSERLADWERRFRHEIERLWLDLDEAGGGPLDGDSLRDRVERAADIFLELDDDALDAGIWPSSRAAG